MIGRGPFIVCFEQRTHSRVHLPRWLAWKSNKIADEATEFFHSVVDRIVQERRQAQEQPDDLLTTLLTSPSGEHDGQLADEDVRSEILNNFVLTIPGSLSVTSVFDPMDPYIYLGYEKTDGLDLSDSFDNSDDESSSQESSETNDQTNDESTSTDTDTNSDSDSGSDNDSSSDANTDNSTDNSNDSDKDSDKESDSELVDIKAFGFSLNG